MEYDDEGTEMEMAVCGANAASSKKQRIDSIEHAVTCGCVCVIQHDVIGTKTKLKASDSAT